MKVTAILKSRIGDIVVTATDPEGRQKSFNFNKSNDWTLEIPTEMRYTDVWGNEHVYQKNFAQHILDNVKDLNAKSETFGQTAFELVEEVKHPVMESVKVVDKNKPIKESKKEKKDEKQS